MQITHTLITSISTCVLNKAGCNSACCTNYMCIGYRNIEIPFWL